MSIKINKIFLSACFLFTSAILATGQGVSRTECFPFEKLSSDQRKTAEALLLKALDEAALYTIVGGIKPMSTGIRSFQLQVSLPRMSFVDAQAKIKELEGKDAESLSSEQRTELSQAKQSVDRSKVLEDLELTRSILEKWRCGDEIYAGVQHFQRQFEGKRFQEVFIINRTRLRQVLTEKKHFFSRWGVTSSSHPEQVLYAVENESNSARFAGYGYLFGYPEHAVRFFVQASDEETFSGRFVTRDFISIPTFARDTNFFVYAVPKGHSANEADTQLRSKAAPILAEYRKRRTDYIGDGKKGVLELVRDWFCSDSSGCASSNAKF